MAWLGDGHTKPYILSTLGKVMGVQNQKFQKLTRKCQLWMQICFFFGQVHLVGDIFFDILFSLLARCRFLVKCAPGGGYVFF